MRFLHSADWQLGSRFAQFGDKGTFLREARVLTLQTALDAARSRRVEVFLIAGDLLEDNQVDDRLVTRVLNLFADYPSVRVFILPGNHDPITGPDAVSARAQFAKPPANVHVLTQPDVIDLDGVWLMASPLQQKMSTVDPSLKLLEMARALPRTVPKVGIAHGALAIPGRHQPGDFPIALNAASRAGLDYLAMGHWHNRLADTDGGRIVMPGTPEPDSFEHERCGYVALVEIAEAGAPPKVEPLRVAALTWRSLTLDLLSQGTKEQLLLCQRVAVALELATTEPQVLILDDVLTNTDPTRQERVLDTLSNAAARLQILILTCHGERYCAVGRMHQLTVR
jgi:DNA repair exonuclease SbcCD nuclease subunit